MGESSEIDQITTGGSESGELGQQAAAAVTTATPQDADSDDASLSDDDVPGGDELLSYLIQAAMPKKRHHHHHYQHWKQQPVSMRGRAAVATPTVTSDGAARRPEPPTHRASRSNTSTPRDFHLSNTTTTQHRSSSPAAAAADVLDRSTTPSDLPHSGGGTSASKLPPAPAYSWTAEPSEDLMMSYAVEGTPDSYSCDRSPTAQSVLNPLVSRTGGGVDEGSWNSSLSSLSLDSSLNAEPTPEESALLRDCINAALPKSRVNKKNDSARRKKSSGSQQQQPLRTSPSGSSESSLKRHPVNLVASPAEPDLANDSPRSQEDVLFPASSWQLPRSDNKDVSGHHPEEFSPKSQKDRVNSMSGGDAEMDNGGGVSEGDACGDIMSECLPDVGLLDVALDDESLLSGPSTEANNTVIYVGASPMDTSHAGSLAAVASQQPGDVGVAAACNVAEGEVVVSEVLSADDVMPTCGVNDNSCSNSTDALITADLSPPDQVQHGY